GKRLVAGACETLDRHHAPVRWDVADPGDAGGLHGDGGVEALRDRLVDERGALLGQERDQALLLLDERVDGGGLPVEEVSDGALASKLGRRQLEVLEVSQVEYALRCSGCDMPLLRH